MLPNILLWTICCIFLGIVGYLLEANSKKKITTNTLAAFFGFFPFAGLVHFLVWPVPPGELNVVATFIGLVTGYVAVNLEDNFFKTPY
jgi:ATP/ADP translocase